MMLKLNIVGAGHVGRVLGKLFAQHHAFEVQDVMCRSQRTADEGVRFIGAGTAIHDIHAMRQADAYMLSVSDDQIELMCAELAARMPLDGAIVFHCSGAKSSLDLIDAAREGADTGSLHPIRSFADPARVAADFAGTFCGVEGSARALATLQHAAGLIGARPVAVDSRAKAVYHAASVFASNYVVTVLDAALRAYEAAGIPPAVAMELAKPLATETVANVFRLGPVAALSGPIARGDFVTVAAQQAALDGWDEPTGQLYEALVEATSVLAERKHHSH